ncbi:MAG TPA: chemotaxis response regulator protein-glutamate methylesterase [Anaeromyxobacter sp.]
MTPTPTPLRVLVVDDSAVVRQALTQILGSVGMQVVTASDPIIAMDKMRREPPDVVVLDIEMPRMDGLTFLQKLMAEQPLPVVVCSGLAGPGTEVALHALEEGAVDVVTKPRLGVKGFLEDSARRLVTVVRAAAEARVRVRRPRVPAVPRLDAGAVVPKRAPPVIRETTHKVVVVGASTGGTEALRELLEAMPPDAPGIAIVQHMPEVFTAQFAKRLDQTCRIEVKEAQTNDRLVSGRALIAPGNRHLVVRRSGAHYFADVVDGPPVSLHRPSVNVLFRSAAQAAGSNAVGVILTGMGDDGAEGLAELRKAGARTIAQDEATCVVFGMPKEAIAAGGVEEVLPLGRIALQVLKWAR